MLAYVPGDLVKVVDRGNRDARYPPRLPRALRPACPSAPPSTPMPASAPMRWRLCLSGTSLTYAALRDQTARLDAALRALPARVVTPA